MTTKEAIKIRKAKFMRAFHFVIVSEGGTNDDPVDRGGLTNWGISQKQYPHLDIKALTIETAKQIYLRDYWYRNKCDGMNPDLGLIVFDCSVNCGQGSAAKWVQRSCNKLGGSLKVDGVIGNKTIDEVFRHSTSKLESLVTAERLRRYVWLLNEYPEQIKFIKGWTDRVANLIDFKVLSDITMFESKE